jgi:site-specific DNA-cytosine methylase
MSVEYHQLIASEPMPEARAFSDGARVAADHTFGDILDGAKGEGFCHAHNKVCRVPVRQDDIYYSTPPCPAFSVQNRGRFKTGAADSTARAVAAGDAGVQGTFEHMRTWKPRLVIMEEVKGFLAKAQGEEKSPWDVLKKDVPGDYDYMVFSGCASVWLEVGRERVFILFAHKVHGGGMASEVYGVTQSLWVVSYEFLFLSPPHPPP